MPTISEFIDQELPFDRMAHVSKAIALAYRASGQVMRAHPVLQTNPKAAAGYIKRACVDHFLANIPRDNPGSNISASLENNRNGSSQHIVLRTGRLVMTAHHVQSSRKKMIKNSLYNRALSSPNYDLFGDTSGESSLDITCGQLLHGAGNSLEFMSLVIPDSDCKIALYTRHIPLPSTEEVREEKIDDEIQNIFEKLAQEATSNNGILNEL